MPYVEADLRWTPIILLQHRRRKLRLARAQLSKNVSSAHKLSKDVAKSTGTPRIHSTWSSTARAGKIETRLKQIDLLLKYLAAVRDAGQDHTVEGRSAHMANTETRDPGPPPALDDLDEIETLVDAVSRRTHAQEMKRQERLAWAQAATMPASPTFRAVFEAAGALGLVLELDDTAWMGGSRALWLAGVIPGSAAASHPVLGAALTMARAQTGRRLRLVEIHGPDGQNLLDAASMKPSGASRPGSQSLLETGAFERAGRPLVVQLELAQPPDGHHPGELRSVRSAEMTESSCPDCCCTRATTHHLFA
eukprot:COSAG01_NODE_8753_length_2672_cov_1.793626_3_plen_307_part_00